MPWPCEDPTSGRKSAPTSGKKSAPNSGKAPVSKKDKQAPAPAPRAGSPGDPRGKVPMPVYSDGLPPAGSFVERTAVLLLEIPEI